MDAAARQRAQEHRQRCNEGFTFAGCHFGDFALVENDAADELNVVVDHVPGDFIAAGEPVVLIDCFAFGGYADKVAALGCQVAVELRCFDLSNIPVIRMPVKPHRNYQRNEK